MSVKDGRKRLKVYLEPDSNATIPPATKWRRRRANVNNRCFDDQNVHLTASSSNVLDINSSGTEVEEHGCGHFQEAGPSHSRMKIQDQETAADSETAADCHNWSHSTESSGEDSNIEDVACNDHPQFAATQEDTCLNSDITVHEGNSESDSEYEEDADRDNPEYSSNLSDDESDQDDSDHVDFDETLNYPLFEGSNVSKAEALLMVLSFVMRHCLSATAVCHLFELLNLLFGRFIFQSTKSILRHIFCNNIIQLSFHFYCLSCFSFVRSFNSVSDENIPVSCPQCRTACVVSDLSHSNFFVTANLSSQVQCLFERADITPHLTYRDTRHKQYDGNIEDIFDGEMYKKMADDDALLGNNYNFSYSFNSDGIPVFKSSKYSLWPIYLMINELPPKLRYDNLILAGVWFGKVEPKMQVFLEKFTSEANKLSESGVSWKRGDEIICSKLFGLCCCADAPARSAMQNTIRFNGYSGCGLCYHPGKIIDGVIKYPVDVCDFTDRTDDEMLNDMIQSFQENRTVRGVKGPSALINLHHFPICWGFPPDFMHCLLLGVARQLSELWFSSEAVNPFFIGSQRLVSIISNRMKAIKPPSVIARAPRPISERKYWKASEWYTWLIFYSVPCLKGILPKVYWEHLIILVEASFLLLQKSLSVFDLQRSDILMFHFVCRCQLLYGSGAMTFNIHSLTHLSKSVRLWGPLWTHSCFSFEAANWRIKRQLQGNRGIIMQVVQKFLTLQMLPLFIEHQYISPRVKALTAKILNINRKEINGMHGVHILGSGCSRYCTPQERDALSAIGYVLNEDNSVLVYTRLRKDGMLFCTAGYRTETMTRNNRLVAFADDKVGELLSVLLIDDQCIMIVKCLVLQEEVTFRDDESNSNLSHLKVCTGYAEIVAIRGEEAMGNCMSMNVDGILYIAAFPNYVALN